MLVGANCSQLQWSGQQFGSDNGRLSEVMRPYLEGRHGLLKTKLRPDNIQPFRNQTQAEVPEDGGTDRKRSQGPKETHKCNGLHPPIRVRADMELTSVLEAQGTCCDIIGQSRVFSSAAVKSCSVSTVMKRPPFCLARHFVSSMLCSPVQE